MSGNESVCYFIVAFDFLSKIDSFFFFNEKLKEMRWIRIFFMSKFGFVSAFPHTLRNNKHWTTWNIVSHTNANIRWHERCGVRRISPTINGQIDGWFCHRKRERGSEATTTRKEWIEIMMADLISCVYDLFVGIHMSFLSFDTSTISNNKSKKKDTRNQKNGMSWKERERERKLPKWQECMATTLGVDNDVCWLPFFFFFSSLKSHTLRKLHGKLLFSLKMFVVAHSLLLFCLGLLAHHSVVVYFIYYFLRTPTKHHDQSTHKYIARPHTHTNTRTHKI